MSTHNIDFYEDLIKIIIELSSIIIKYAPYFFCCWVGWLSHYSVKFQGSQYFLLIFIRMVPALLLVGKVGITLQKYTYRCNIL